MALAAGVPASTVVLSFRRAPGDARRCRAPCRYRALPLAGEAISGLIRGNAPPDDPSVQDLIKATSMIALASAREPSLVPYAIDMRRRRGENWRASDMERLGIGIGAGFDRAAAQLLSIAAFGMGMIGMARKLPERDYSRACPGRVRSLEMAGASPERGQRHRNGMTRC